MIFFVAEIMDDEFYEEPDFDMEQFAKLTGGDNDNNSSVDITVNDNDVQVEVYKPQLTRETMSKFEFVRTITAVAKYLYTLPDLSKYCKDVEINSLINPAELAFELIMNGKINATLNRLGYEKVTFSELKVNPIWVNMIRNYYKRRHEIERGELLEPLGLNQPGQKL